ncbi:MAG: ribonuclease III [Alphaproteobacteria bacterium]|nr:ribonuclease III [Alphaproteobacteria bacterium]
MSPVGKISDLTARLGHEFAKADLLQDALTHPSLAGQKPRKKGRTTPYERLEFLGDRVLGLVIADWLYQLFPDSNEGDLAKRHAALVNRDALRAIALEIGLEKHVRLARGEDASAARKNLATLSDAMEALIGALYLDGGIEVARAFIQRYWRQATAVEEAPADPKTALQEWAQGRGLPLPVYKVLERSGPAHAPKFIIQVSVKDFEPMQAEGPSKRLAEKAAAQLLLEQVAETKKA